MSHELGHRPKPKDPSSIAPPPTRGAQRDVVLQLQRSYGNQAVRGLLATPLQSEPQPVSPENDTGLPDDLKSGVESLWDVLRRHQRVLQLTAARAPVWKGVVKGLVDRDLWWTARVVAGVRTWRR